MTDDFIEVSFKCGACGAKIPASAVEESPTDDSIVTCKACNETFRYGDIKANAKKAVLDSMRAKIREAARRK